VAVASYLSFPAAYWQRILLLMGVATALGTSFRRKTVNGPNCQFLQMQRPFVPVG
jgi:hypothetical protein